MPRPVSRALSFAFVLAGMAAAAAAQTPYLVKDLIPGSGTGGGPVQLTNVNGTLFFGLNNQFSNGIGLWKSDGTAAGTVQLTTQSPVHAPAAVGANLFFSPVGSQIWKSDGTPAGTVLVTDLAPGDLFGRIDYMGSLNGALLFTAADLGQLWRSDGTSTGTVMLKDFGSDYVSNVRGGPFVVAGGLAFFNVCTSGGGCGLWRTDGTPAGTILLKSFGIFHGPDWLTASGSRVLFQAGDDVAGNELWRSDGTPAGTVLVKDVEPGAFSASPGWIADVNGTVYFFASGGYTGHNGLWKSDGTGAGTVQIDGTLTADFMTNVNGTLFFVASTALGRELWKSNGTTPGTVLVKDINPGSADSIDLVNAELRSLQGRLWFRADAGASSGAELWTSDGTTGGTTLVGDIYPGGSASTPTQLTPAGDKLFFVANDGVHDRELWAVQVPTTISIDDPSILEGNTGTTLMSFTLTLGAASTSNVTVNYSTSSGTATSGTDFTTASGTWTIPAGSTSKKFVIVVKSDTVAEADETFTVTLSNPVNATFAKSTGTGHILNDDPATAATQSTQYRLYHIGTLEHLYTTDLNEYNVLGGVGWNQEGVAYKMLTNGLFNLAYTVPLYRLYHPGILQHHWTTDSNEALVLSQTTTWFYEGIVGYLLPTQVSGTTPLYRMALANPPLHLWTTDANEYAVLQTRGWIAEGIIGYVIP